MNQEYTLIAVKTFQTRLEAQIAKGFLEANHIQAMVSADDEGGMAPYPIQPTPRGALVFVQEKDAAKAKKLLQAIPQK